MPASQNTVTTSTDILIHNGFAWRLEYSASIATTATDYLGFTTGPFGAIILDRTFTSTGDDTIFTLYRATSWTGGTPLTLKNRNDRWWANVERNPAITLAGGVTSAPSAANSMGSVRLRAIGPPVAVIGGDVNQIVLAPNSSYVVGTTNLDPNTETASFTAIIMQDRISSGVMTWPLPS